LWQDGKLVFGSVRNLAYLSLAGGYAIWHEHRLEEHEDDFFHNHTFYGSQLSDALQAQGSGLTLYLGLLTWYFVALGGDHPHSYEASKTVLSAMTVTAIATTTLKLVIPDGRPSGGKHDFPSGHASQTMALAASFDELYGHWVGVPSYLLAGAVALQRLDERKHDSGSVLFAMLLGYLIGKTVAAHHARRIFGLDVGVGIDPEIGAATLNLTYGL
jgi:membrane-associated phospholipid phosphatase